MMAAPKAKKPAKWAAGPLGKKTAAGTLEARVPVTDDGVLVGHVKFTITDARALRVVWEAEPGSPPLEGFEAWEEQR
jgi:hypothetical protein